MYIAPIWIGLILGMTISLVAVIALGYYASRGKK